jgi:hypothetical protein
MTLRFFALAPEIVFKARVNASAFTYPISQVAFDGVTVGAYTDIQRNQTILFGTTEGDDDLGRQRTGPIDATADTLYFGRCSEGTNDGEVSLQDDAYITILLDWRVWSRPPYIDPTGVIYKDGQLTVGVYTTTPPPVANAGIPAAGTIDSVSGVLRVQLPSGSQTSFATAAGATITAYSWTLPTGVALAGGYALTDPIIEVDADPGFHWISLVVTDSNGQTHRARTFIIADDPDDSLFITGVTVQSHRRTQEGQTLTVQLTEDLPPGTYPDGTLVALVDGEPASGTDRTNILFWGWHQTDPATIRARRTGLTRYTQLTCVDVAGRLAALPGFPQVVENDDVRDTDAYPTITWAHMVGLTLDLYIHYLLQWHSTVLDLTDYFATGTTSIYSIGGAISSDGGSLWEQVKRRVKAFVPSKSIGCDAWGRLLVRADPLEEASDQRTSNVNAALTMADVSEIRFTHKRTPDVHWLRGNAIQAISPLPVGDDGEIYQPTFFCIAPGDVPGQGETEETRGEQLSPSQTLLNTSTGHHYARINARESLFDLTLVGDDWVHLDPAAQEWVTLTLDAAYAAQRGLSFTAARGVLHEVDFGYPTGPTGTTRTCRSTWERETVGHPALTVTQPDVDPVDDGNDDWYTPPVVPVAPPADLPEGVEVVALLADDGGLFRTADFQTASGSGGPTWDKVALATGALYTWVVDPFSPGYINGVGAINGWAVDEDDIWRITDIFGSAVATSILTFSTPATAASHHWRTIQASFGRYFAEGSNPWLLCISYYGDTDGHEGTWATYSTDGGATWATEVLVSAGYDIGLTAPNPLGIYTSPKTPGLAYTAAYTESGVPGPTDGYVTTNWGETWTAVSAAPEDDETNPIPYWGIWDDVLGQLISIHTGARASAYADTYANTEIGSNTERFYMICAPPQEAIRVTLRCRYSNTRVCEDPGLGACAHNDDIDTTPAIGTGETTDLSYVSETNVSYDLEWTDSDGDWRGDRDELLVWDEVSLNNFCRIEVFASSAASGIAEAWNTTSNLCEITEIELFGGYIYTPPLYGSGLIQPINGQGGSIHLPWLDNDAEDVAYFGALHRLDNREFSLMRHAGGVLTDISPNDGTRDYGVHRPGFGVRTYDLNRQYAAFAGVGNGTSADAANDLYALYVSSDNGDTWTLRDGPDAVGTAHATEVAFSSNNPLVLLTWGSDGYIQYSSDSGATLDSRAGNLATVNGGTAPDLIIGLAGGPTG